MIRDAAIDELFTVATSLVAAKRNVVLNKLISIRNDKNELSTIDGIVTKLHQTLQLTFHEPRIADAVVHGILWPDNKYSVTDVIRTA
jgi:fructosamine-3-kinase